MLRKIINRSLLQGLYRINKNVNIPSRALSSQTQARFTPLLLTPSCACRSSLRCCSSEPGGDYTALHANSPPSPSAQAPVLESTQKNYREIFNIDTLVALLRQENAQDICVIHVPDELKYVEYFVVVSGSSTRHLRAMAFYAVKVYKFMRESEDPHVQIEGKDAEDWMCVDFGDMVVHFMLPQIRETYELEKLWTLRHYDDQLSRIPPETLPTDFIYGADAYK